MYLGHVSGRKVVPDCRRLGRDRRLQIVGCKKDIPCVLASTLINYTKFVRTTKLIFELSTLNYINYTKFVRTTKLIFELCTLNYIKYKLHELYEPLK